MHTLIRVRPRLGRLPCLVEHYRLLRRLGLGRPYAMSRCVRLLLW